MPSQGRFLLVGTLTTAISCLVLDLLGQQQQQPNPIAPALFHKDLIPLFSRLGEVTLARLKLRAFSIAGFAMTVWCIISGSQAAAATVGVALGLSEPNDWRPPFGVIADGYSMLNLKVWHQFLRRIITSPARATTCDVLGIPPHPVFARLSIIFLSFGISGLMHHCASVSAGMPVTQTNVLQFFATQAFGCIIEGGIVALYQRMSLCNNPGPSESPPLAMRLLRYVWVIGFMIWSGPIWLYPQASRPPPVGVPAGFLPYSVVRAWKTGIWI